jgi:hypothetical protein
MRRRNNEEEWKRYILRVEILKNILKWLKMKRKSIILKQNVSKWE